MQYRRMPIESESPEEFGYSSIKLNLAESSMPDRRLADVMRDIPSLKLEDLVLQYTDHKGSLAARRALVKGTAMTEENVLLTHGAVSALFIIHSALMRAGDRLLVLRPNYATNLETPFALGVDIDAYDLLPERGYALDVDDFISRITASVKLVSITTPHNPTGNIIPAADIRRIAAAVKERAHPECMLLVDQTYHELVVDGLAPWYAEEDERIISVCSLSKTYGLPGIRIGWIMCKHAKIMEIFLAAKEQIAISGSVIDEAIAAQVLENREALLAAVHADLSVRRAMLAEWLPRVSDLLDCAMPAGGVVCFPRIKPSLGIEPKDFYQKLFADHGAIVGPGHWFERGDESFRLGFGWPTRDELATGLAAIETVLRSLQRA